ncbi:DoxX family protein [Flagellimonas myxillae]|uniref:DoxX family protein n=1 Tax=Flagellimonas myxillae TaxID=2942214 RepID=UPI00201EC188|nr:DoxX family protein [Muricauda myxillae]MCL6266646.1 DoxX family protein [Muricauda myxillae]
MEHFTSHAAQILLLAGLTITFLQSGFDKILDWKGNLSWLTGHFSKTVFKGMVPLLLGIVLFAEMASGILCAIGLFEFFYIGESAYAFCGAVLASITLLFLLLGQRIAKDYEGAKTIVVYLILAIFLVYILQ